MKKKVFKFEFTSQEICLLIDCVARIAQEEREIDDPILEDLREQLEMMLEKLENE